MQSHFLSNILFSFSGAGKFYLKTYSRGKMSRAQSSRIYSSTYRSFSALRSPSEVVLRKRHQCNTFIPHPDHIVCFVFSSLNITEPSVTPATREGSTPVSRTPMPSHTQHDCSFTLQTCFHTNSISTASYKPQQGCHPAITFQFQDSYHYHRPLHLWVHTHSSLSFASPHYKAQVSFF